MQGRLSRKEWRDAGFGLMHKRDGSDDIIKDEAR